MAAAEKAGCGAGAAAKAPSADALRLSREQPPLTRAELLHLFGVRRQLTRVTGDGDGDEVRDAADAGSPAFQKALDHLEAAWRLADEMVSPPRRGSGAAGGGGAAAAKRLFSLSLGSP